MQMPHWRHLTVDSAVLVEPTHDDNRLVLWVPGGRTGEFQNWERIGSDSRARVMVEGAVCTVAATLTPARQQVGGLFRRLFLKWGRKGSGATLFLPDGGEAE